MMRRTGFALLSIWLAAMAPAGRLQAAELQAGVAVVDITPPLVVCQRRTAGWRPADLAGCWQ
jgi:hypothetical protein